jgi:hypothetical protein
VTERLPQVFDRDGQVLVNGRFALNSVLLPELPPAFVSRRNVIYATLEEHSQVRP